MKIKTMSISPSNSEVAVLYLARKAEGVDSFLPFIGSYLSNSAGMEHDVVVILKGYDQGENLEGVKAVFSNIDAEFMPLPDEGYDLDSYRQAAEAIHHEYICCCNTFSTIRAEDWLKKLYTHVSAPEVGLVGATGSYESNRDSLIYFQKIIWQRLYSRYYPKRERAFRKYCDVVLDHMCPQPPDDYEEKERGRDLIESLRATMDDLYYRIFLENREFKEWWNKISNSVPDFRDLCAFPPFPNPHVRTNAFMMNRSDYVSLAGEASGGKLDTSRIESGPRSLTRQIVGRGLRAQIVGQNGTAYDIPEWTRSETFRLGRQDNLLMVDNRTRDFDQASAGWRVTISWLSWGQPAIDLPSDFPHLNTKLKSGGKLEFY